jgi:uncharacterized Zn finger protein (UPF0148 family)
MSDVYGKCAKCGGSLTSDHNCSERVKFKIPEDVRKAYTGKKCPKHKAPLFFMNGITICGQCQLETAELNRQSTQDANTDPERLKQYYNDKQPKSKRDSTLEQSEPSAMEKIWKGIKK